MEFDRIGFYCQSKEAEDNIKKVFGLQNASWVKDTVTCLSEVRGRKPFRNQFESQVNSDLDTNIEILRYTEGNFWLEGDLISVPNDVPVFSHMGFFLEDRNFPQMPKHWKLVQESFSQHHSNPAPNRKLLQYRTYDTMSRTYIQFVRWINV